MRKIYVLRHADWNLETGRLTAKGRVKCLELKSEIGSFYMVLSSDFVRSKETAKLLTGKQPQVDARAGILKLTESQNKNLGKLRQKHPLGVAGVIFSTPELIEPVRRVGQNLVELIKETISKLPENGMALIISHDGTMVSAEKLLTNDSFKSIKKTYFELEGFIVNENLELSKF